MSKQQIGVVGMAVMGEQPRAEHREPWLHRFHFQPFWRQN